MDGFRPLRIKVQCYILAGPFSPSIPPLKMPSSLGWES